MLGALPIVELSWLGKLRGPGFEPIAFEIASVECDKRAGTARAASSPRRSPATSPSASRRNITAAARNDQDDLLIAMLDTDRASIAQLAEKLNWMTGASDKLKPHKSKVKRLMDALSKDKMAKKVRSTWVLTEAGTKEAEKVKLNRELAGAKYG